MADSLLSLARPELAELTAYAPVLPPGVRVRLDANEAPPITSSLVRDVVREAIGRVALERYPDARASELKEAIFARTGVPADELLVGTGSDEVISLLLTALSRQRGRGPTTLLVPTPTFVMYRITGRGHGWRVVEVPLDDAWDLAVASMKKALELTEPNVVFIASPNNPTGNRMADDRVEQVLEAARGALVVVDEAYADYAGSSVRGWRARHSNLAILRTLSKLGLAALRIGWLEGPKEIVAAVDKVRQPFNVSATSQVAAAAVMRDAWTPVLEHVEEVRRERERIVAAMRAIEGVTPLPTHANFVWVRTSKPAAEVHAGLLAKGVLVRSFHAAGGRLGSHVRITVGTPVENDALLEALRSVA